MNNKVKKTTLSILKGIAVALFWLLVWWLLAAAVNKELLLPTPFAVGERFFELIITAEFWRITLASLLRIILGFICGMAAGIILAIAMFKNKVIYAIFSPVIKIVRAAPVASFILLALVWLASGVLPVFISALMVLPIAWANTFTGIEETDKQLLVLADMFHVGIWRKWRNIYLPSLQPYILAAATTGMGLAWKSGITAEVIAYPKMAIGGQLQTAKVYLETADVFVWTIVVILLAICLEKLLQRLLKRGRRK